MIFLVIGWGWGRERLADGVQKKPALEAGLKKNYKRGLLGGGGGGGGGGAGVAVGDAALGHGFNAGFGVGVRGEHLGDVALLDVAATFHVLEFLEGHNHAPGVLTFGNKEVVAAVVGLFFLLLGVFGINEGTAEGAELRFGQGSGLAAGRGDGVFEGSAEELVLERFAGVALDYVTDFVADDAEELVVVHDIHQRGEDAHAAVGAGEGVDVNDFVNLEVQGDTVGVGDACGQTVQTLCVGVIVGSHGIVFVHPFHGFLDVGSHIFVGEGESLHGLFGTAEGFAEVELSACCPEGKQCGSKCKNYFRKYFHSVFNL